MTLTEYSSGTRQTTKLPSRSVEVKLSDLALYESVGIRNPMNQKIEQWRTVLLKAFGYTYLLLPNDTTLWVMDSDGNPRAPSVFKLKESL